MKIHTIDLNQSPSSDTKPVVDDVLLNNHNHDSSHHSVQQHTTSMQKSQIVSALVFILALSAGVATGFGSHQLVNTSTNSQGTSESVVQVAGNSISAGDVFGSTNPETFKDDATGYLEKGGLDGEGSHKLLRPGGESQTVYLTSSVTDLDKLVDMEVKVWGETFSGQKAGWLMDVGRIEVIDTDALPPTEE